MYQKLEFDKVRQLLEQVCLGDLGRQIVADLSPMLDMEAIAHRLTEVSEYKRTLEKNDHFPINRYEDISEELRMLEVEGFVLPEDGLRRLNVVLRYVRNLFRYFNKLRQEAYPVLYQAICHVTFDESLIAAIEKVIDEEGEIRPDASPELMRIRRQMGSKLKELDRQFRVLANEYKGKGWLADNVESFRNGRRVLAVQSENKRKIRGIIHDESTTGRTAYIEPEGVIEINNDIFDLETEERREIYRILKELSAVLRPYVPHMRVYLDLLVYFDVIQAKARLAIMTHANQPNLRPGPHMGIRKGYHPLLLLKNAKLGKEVVPFDLELLHNNHIIVISGPNAGGKSITMKAVGLLQLMLQSGLLVPVDATSEMGIFQHIFADIGDQQSLEDDLSTYSSRLENARVFLEHANEHSMVLIDEFGSGTDPKMGGAIAEAILWELNHKRVFGVVTTHYSNLKIFAFKTKGLVNGAMTFDNDTLSPTYQLKVGRPGSSYAFEIAHKSGLTEKVLKYARHKAGDDQKAVEDLLIDLQREKQEAEELTKSLRDKQEALERLMRSYEQMQRDIEFRRKRSKLEAKEQDLRQVADSNKEFERLIREIKEEKNLEKAKEMALQVKAEREQLAQQVTALQQEVYYQPLTKKEAEKGEIKVGDFVRLRSGGATGQVDSMHKHNVMIVMGDVRMQVKLRDLVHANEPLDVRSTASVNSDTVEQSAAFQPKLDIRGTRVEEAMKMVEEFMDNALVMSSTTLRIVHGKGNGVLRQVVRNKVREYHKQATITMSHPAPEYGGDGVTVVEMS